MAQTIGNRGVELNLLIKQGSTFGPHRLKLRDPITHLPINLTGSMLRAHIRKKALDVALTAAIVIDNYDYVGGEADMSLPFAVTEAIAADEVFEKPGSLYTWDLEMVDSLTRVIPIFYGEVQVFREVTRA